MQRCEEEAFGRLGIASRPEEKFQGSAFRVDCSIQIHPRFADFDVRFVDFPGVIGGFEVRSTTLVDLRGRVLHPTRDGTVIDRESALPHHLFQVAIPERVPQVSAHAEQDDLGFAHDTI
jgi:hypothetical protein